MARHGEIRGALAKIQRSRGGRGRHERRRGVSPRKWRCSANEWLAGGGGSRRSGDGARGRRGSAIGPRARRLARMRRSCSWRRRRGFREAVGRLHRGRCACVRWTPALGRDGAGSGQRGREGRPRLRTSMAEYGSPGGRLFTAGGLGQRRTRSPGSEAQTHRESRAHGGEGDVWRCGCRVRARDG
ncbi:pollen-specific leucine-rich repeat extensin-like protein 3 [Iris pallida]|uniref:Pollen-specific leucine-rich repeat extensin-like protein 3 n=1 Tax=Iris pallida TaxID=29817 RepID=A0AAX6H5Q0_IRIPA|nr:pollen-specific leucine-rich repeat extensin-like protein 3 [Iris pallida]